MVPGGATTEKLTKKSGTDYDTQWSPPWSRNAYVNTTAPAGTPAVGDEWFNPSGGTSALALPLSVANGGTAATNAPLARTNLGIRAEGDSTTVAGAPTTGTWVRGDTWLDSLNVLWVCTAGGTPGAWVSNMNRGEELAYNERTSNFTITALSAPTAQTVIAGTTRSYDGTPIVCALHAPSTLAPASSFIVFSLFDGATEIGWLCSFNAPAASGIYFSADPTRKLTPSVGTHTYSVAAWISGSGTGTMQAGPGTTGTYSPAFLRITRA